MHHEQGPPASSKYFSSRNSARGAFECRIQCVLQLWDWAKSLMYRKFKSQNNKADQGIELPALHRHAIPNLPFPFPWSDDACLHNPMKEHRMIDQYSKRAKDSQSSILSVDCYRNSWSLLAVRCLSNLRRLASTNQRAVLWMLVQLLASDYLTNSNPH